MKCKFFKEDGEQCGAHAMRGEKYCFLHNPKISEERKREIQIRGGKANKIMIKESLPVIKIKEVKDVVVLLSDTVDRVRAGLMDIKVANCLGILSGQLLRAFEITEIESRVEYIEREIKERRIRMN